MCFRYLKIVQMKFVQFSRVGGMHNWSYMQPAYTVHVNYVIHLCWYSWPRVLWNKKILVMKAKRNLRINYKTIVLMVRKNWKWFHSSPLVVYRGHIIYFKEIY